MLLLRIWPAALRLRSQNTTTNLLSRSLQRNSYCEYSHFTILLQYSIFCPALLLLFYFGTVTIQTTSPASSSCIFEPKIQPQFRRHSKDRGSKLIHTTNIKTSTGLPRNKIHTNTCTCMVSSISLTYLLRSHTYTYTHII